MRIIIHAEDKSGRGDGYYTKSDMKEALDIFFSKDEVYYLDPDQEEEMTREYAEVIFDENSLVAFYNEDDEKIVISLDPSVL